VRPGDALCQPILPELWEPILVNADQFIFAANGRYAGAAAVQQFKLGGLADNASVLRERSLHPERERHHIDAGRPSQSSRDGDSSAWKREVKMTGEAG